MNKSAENDKRYDLRSEKNTILNFEFSLKNLVLFSALPVVLFACVVTAQYQVGDPCDVGDHEDNTGSYRKHPNNCGYYLQCLHGTYGQRSCPEGLHWNEEDSACDWPQKANCVAFDLVEEEVVGGYCNVGDHEENAGSYRPHPSDCGKYLQCLHSQFGERPCPEGLHWNAEQVACDWPEKANCVQRMNVVGGTGYLSYGVNEQVYPVPSIQNA